MSEPAPSDVPYDAAQSHAGAMTQEAIERLLADFRSWLSEASQESLRGLTPPARQEPPDLHTLLGQMIAIRQEVNLQTKTVRAQQEQNSESLRVLEETVELLQRMPRQAAPAQTSPDDLIRPLLKTLIDVHDAMSLAYREAQRVQESVLPLLETMSVSRDLSNIELPKLEQPERSFLEKLFGVQTIQTNKLEEWQMRTWAMLEKVVIEGEQSRKQGMERVEQMLASLMAGYRMGLKRIERALEQQGLEVIEAMGTTFDPERMEVLEAVDGSGRTASEVLAEVRRGYLWRGRVFRYAQVRVARS